MGVDEPDLRLDVDDFLPVDDFPPVVVVALAVVVAVVDFAEEVVVDPVIAAFCLAISCFKASMDGACCFDDDAERVGGFVCADCAFCCDTLVWACEDVCTACRCCWEAVEIAGLEEDDCCCC